MLVADQSCLASANMRRNDADDGFPGCHQYGCFRGLKGCFRVNGCVCCYHDVLYRHGFTHGCLQPFRHNVSAPEKFQRINAAGRQPFADSIGEGGGNHDGHDHVCVLGHLQNHDRSGDDSTGGGTHARRHSGDGKVHGIDSDAGKECCRRMTHQCSHGGAHEKGRGKNASRTAGTERQAGCHKFAKEQ